ncbi:MAG: indolepyruvate oxidoreductase subunit beta [Clostridia bacterium]|nr:indolepyruvate oxidoreductase subunit beta [Clostridia bacterium]
MSENKKAENGTVSILIVGVGGQGTLLASKILGRILVGRGYDVKVSELHGMSQRGGSVTTYVKYGKKVFSPVIEAGEADYIVSFEKLEAARWAHCLKKGGKIITNTQQIDPMPVTSGAAVYPADILEKLKGDGLDIDAFDALSPAVAAGSAKAVNIVLMGRLARYLGIEREVWTDTIKESVAPKFTDINLRAFDAGYSL